VDLKEKVVQAIQRAVDQGNREKQKKYCEYLDWLMEIEEEVDPTENGKDLGELIRHRLEARREAGAKFRIGDISSEIANDYTVDEAEVRDRVQSIIDEYNISEGRSKWLSFDS